MGSRKFKSLVTGSVAAIVVIAGSASASAPTPVSGLSSDLACPVAQIGVASAAQLNPQATQNCVLPVADKVSQASVAEPGVIPAAVGTPQRAVVVTRGMIIAGAVASGLVVAYVASKGSNSRVSVSG